MSKTRACHDSFLHFGKKKKSTIFLQTRELFPEAACMKKNLVEFVTNNKSLIERKVTEKWFLEGKQTKQNQIVKVLGLHYPLSNFIHISQSSL